MAWKRLKPFKDGTVIWRNTKDKDLGVIVAPDESRKGGWVFNVDEVDTPLNIGRTMKEFNSKSEAMRFAGKWMREHPNG